jgi:site-specific DNA-methyltransferase (adenine-specific)
VAKASVSHPEPHGLFCHWQSWPDFYDAASCYVDVRNALIWWKARGGMGNFKVEYARDFEVLCHLLSGRVPGAG